MAGKRRSHASTPPKIGPRLKELRLERKLTMDRLAGISGLSKSLLSQIERGQTNATFATLWNLTEALHVDLSALISSAKSKEADGESMELIASHLTPTIKSADGLCELRILSPARFAGNTEWYDLQLQPNGRLESKPHNSGCVEHLTCISGKLLAMSGSKSMGRLKVGDTVRYKADVDHVIENPAGRSARALLVLTF